MNTERLVCAEGLYKKFCSTLKRSMLYGLADCMKDVIGITDGMNALRKGEFWAVENVSFTVSRGECLGIIGQNGAGKSTLLKMLSGIILPDSGRITLNGKVGGLLEIGAGFHPMLTGRENVYINGAILGLSKKEIDRKFDEIVDFAELHDFIDTPVKHYSSGMYVRLGFAIAAQVQPDILIVDEVLAVGDVGFKAKCYKVMSELLETSAVVFVSHSMPEIARLCSKILFLEKGKCRYLGNDVSKGIDLYHQSSPTPNGMSIDTDEAAFEEVVIQDGVTGNEVPEVEFSGNLEVLIKARLKKNIKNPIVHMAILNNGYQNVCHCSSSYSDTRIRNQNGKICVRLTLEDICLRPGTYFLDFAITDEKNIKILARTHLQHKIQILGTLPGYGVTLARGKWENI